MTSFLVQMQKSRAAWVWVGAMTWIISSCRHGFSSVAVAPPGSFAVRAINDTTTWNTYPNYQILTVTIRVRNDGARPLVRHACSAQLQKRLDDRWTTLQTTSCLGIFPEYVSIAPGDSASPAFAFMRHPDPQHPQGDPRLTAGIYRVVLVVGYQEQGDFVLAEPESRRATQPFVVLGT
jgi:hypothetical protein